ncbi:hypothetical protein HP456_12315 [Bacillus haikouensis]|nr:hypothetical protein [Bacillus haikouensis]NQD66704.1 hypothetical protein [Bacillus haikouensis]
MPGTISWICAWYKQVDLYLVQTGGFVPGTNRWICTWYKQVDLYLVQK